MKFNIFLLGLLLVCMICVPILQVEKEITSSNLVSEVSQVQDKENTQKVVQTEKQQEEKKLISVDNIDIETPFKILDTNTGEINTVKQKDYVMGAVCSEMPPDFHTEALKAQAVSAHTYALYRKGVSQSDEYDFEAIPSKWKGYVTKEMAKERYGDKFDIYWGKIEKAVNNVFGNIAVYEGEPILAAYHSMSCGKTEDASNVWQHSIPYLVPTDSEGDLLQQKYEVKTTFNANTVKNILKQKYPDIKLIKDCSKWFEVVEKSDSGYITKIKVGDLTLHGKVVREIFDLRSSDFDVSYSNDVFAFKTKGYGHGVGLSQCGSDYMARQGEKYDEILKHYYTGADIVMAGKDDENNNPFRDMV